MSSCTQMLRAHVRSVANFLMVAMLFVFVLVWTSRWELKGTEKARAMQVEKICCGPASLGEDTQTLCHTGHQAHSPGGPLCPGELSMLTEAPPLTLCKLCWRNPSEPDCSHGISDSQSQTPASSLTSPPVDLRPTAGLRERPRAEAKDKGHFITLAEKEPEFP